MAHRKRSVATFLGVTAIVAGLLSGPALAGGGQSPRASKGVESFVMETGQKVISVLHAGDNHRIVLKKLFRTRFDYKLMGRFALGRFWSKADPGQIIEYNNLFAAYVPNGYVGRLSEYRDADFVLVKSRQLGDSDSVVTTRLAPKDGDVIVFDWRVREENRNYKVIDLMVGSVSYLKTLRQEFTSIAARSGVEGLLELLRQHAAANDANTGHSKHSTAPRHRRSETAERALHARVAALIAALRGSKQGNIIAMR